MSWSPLEVEEQIQAVYEAISAETDGLDALAQSAAHRRHNYEMRNALKWMELSAVKAPEVVKKAMIMSEIGPMKLDAEIAEAMVDAKRASLRSLYVQADLLRSLMATARRMQDAEL